MSLKAEILLWRALGPVRLKTRKVAKAQALLAER
jgi:hypothetical protein